MLRRKVVIGRLREMGLRRAVLVETGAEIEIKEGSELTEEEVRLRAKTLVENYKRMRAEHGLRHAEAEVKLRRLAKELDLEVVGTTHGEMAIPLEFQHGYVAIEIYPSGRFNLHLSKNNMSSDTLIEWARVEEILRAEAQRRTEAKDV